MSQLIQMRNRIKAIETIEKITHAMQLISMSTHARLRERKTHIEEYQNTIALLFKKVASQVPNWHNPILLPTSPPDELPLIILIGSQKGLCGTFNINLFSRFERDLSTGRFPHAMLITIGKKTTDYIQGKLTSFPIPIKPIAELNEINWAQLPEIVTQLATTIMKAENPFSTVVVYSNYPTTFFIQRQQTTTLIPLSITSKRVEKIEEELYWYDSPITITNELAYHYLKASLYDILIKSLLAEQAARFVSMDNATRNAHSLRDTMRLQYYKMRQAKITKELTELSGSFQENLGS